MNVDFSKDVVAFLKKSGLELPKFNTERVTEADKIFIKRGVFEVNTSGYSISFLKYLVDKELINSFDDLSQVEDVSSSDVIALMQESHVLSLDNETGEIVYFIDDSKHILKFQELDTVEIERLSAFVPEVPFDIIQGGNVEKAKEVESLYRICVINKIFMNCFNVEIYNLLQEYDIGKLAGPISFRDLEKKIVEATPNIVRLIMQLCNYKLTNVKTKKEQMFDRSLTTQENQALRQLAIGIANCTNENEEYVQSGRTKAEREVRRQEVRDKIETLINESSVSMIYRLRKLNSEDIPPRDYVKITIAADALAEQVRFNENLNDNPSFVAAIKRKLRRRGFREYLSEFRLSKLKEYKAGGTVELS